MLSMLFFFFRHRKRLDNSAVSLFFPYRRRPLSVCQRPDGTRS